MAEITTMRAVEAIRNITEQTGYPPSPEELAEVLGVTVKSLHSRLMGEKQARRVRYDEEGRFVVGPGTTTKGENNHD